jgi:hypothetical protein
MKERKPYFPVTVTFVIVNCLVIALGRRVESWGIDRDVLIIGNAFMFLITLVSLVVIMKGIRQVKTLSFIRSINVAFIVKFFLVIAAVAIYALSVKEVNRGAVLLSMGLYLVYTFLEVRILLSQMKRKPDGEKGSPD